MLSSPNLSLLEGCPHKSSDLSPREEFLQTQMICLLVANGEPVSIVATKLGLEEKVVKQVVESNTGIELIIRFQRDMCPLPEVRVKKMTSIALDVQTRLMLSPHTPHSVLAKVTNDVIDRAQGKATQVIESRNLHFDLKDAAQIDSALRASHEKLRQIEEMQKKLMTPTGRADAIDVSTRPQVEPLSATPSSSEQPKKTLQEIIFGPAQKKVA